MLVFIDDFSDPSFKFVNHFFSSLDGPDVGWSAMIKNKIGKNLDKIMIVSFVLSMTTDPIIRYKGQEWNILLK